MSRILSISAFIILSISFVCWGTVINVPSDYPTIQQGIDASVNGDTVLVQPGTYVENINFNGHNISLGSLYFTTGDTNYIPQTILDGDSSGSVVTFESGENNNAKIVGFTIQRGSAFEGGGIFCSGSHPVISHNIIQNNESSDLFGGFGGGIACVLSDAIIKSNLIRNNYATGVLGGFGGGIYVYEAQVEIEQNIITANLGASGGGGIYVDFSNIAINNNVIFDNTGSFGGGGLYLYEANPLIVNNVISENEASWTEGGGIYGEYNSNPVIINSIIWLNEGVGGEPDIMIDEGTPIVNYCNIFGGWPGVGNTSLDPYFRDPENGDFHLMSIACGDSADSPCIDAGDPNILDSLLDCSWGLGGLRSDMGAYGGGDSIIVDIFNNNSYLPKEFILLQNYPNPFNSGTTIRFSIVKAMEVRLAVYDLLGREVQTLIDEYKQAGIYTAFFDATDLSSGVYFCRLQAGEAVETRPMVLLR
jgi:hypothetical protein